MTLASGFQCFDWLKFVWAANQSSPNQRNVNWRWKLSLPIGSLTKNCTFGWEPWSSGYESCLRGRGFESRRCILDGHFSHWFVVKIVTVFVWIEPKIKEKEAEVGPFKKLLKLNKPSQIENDILSKRYRLHLYQSLN